MKYKSSPFLSAAIALVSSLTWQANQAHAAGPYYWDGDDITAGFGTASGTWAAPTVGTLTAGWSTSATGGAGVNGVSVTTATTDAVNFGNTTTGLAAGTIAVSGTVNSGSMTFASGSGAIVLSGGSISFAATSTITVNNASDTISSNLIGAGTTLTKAGTGTLILSGSTSTYAGALSVTAGTLNIQSATALGSTAGSTTVSNGAALAFQGGVAVGAEALNIRGAGVGAAGAMRNISGNNSFAGAITLNNSILFGSDADTLTLSGTIAPQTAASRDVSVSGAGNVTLSGVFSEGTSGVATLNKTSAVGSGTGTLTVSANNTFTGATNISAGTLKLGAAGGATNTPLGTAAGGAFVSGTGTLDLNGFSLGTAEALSLIGTGISNSGALANSSVTAATYKGLVTLAGAASIVSTGNIGLTHVGTITGSGFGLTLDGAATGSSITSIIGTGAGTLTKTGSGTWALSGTNTYTGATNITNGTLALSGSGAINTSSGITINGSGARLLQTSSVAGTNGITLTQGTLDGTGTVGAVSVADLVGNKITNGNLASSSALTMGSLTLSGDATFDIRTAGAPGVIVTGVLTTTPANGFAVVNVTSAPVWVTGNTYNLISYGSLSGALGDFSLGAIPGLGARQTPSLVLSGNNIALSIGGDSVRWTGAASNVWTTNAVGTPFNWQTLNGLADTEFLTADDVVFNDSASGAGLVNVDISTANVSPNSVNFTNVTRNYTLSSGSGYGIVTGSLTKSGAATLNLDTTNTYTGATTISEGTLNLTGSLAGTAITVSGTGVLSESSTGVISGAASLTHSGSGTSTLAGANTYTGATAISAGALNLTGSLAGTAITVSGTGVLSESSTGVISGAASLTHSGSGTSTLAGSNTYTGATAISAGTLNLTGSLVDTSITVSGAGVFSESSTGVISGAASLTHSSSGTTTLAGANTFTGTVSVTAGVLNIQNDTALGTIAGGITVAQSVAALELQGGIAVGAEPLLIAGAGVLSNGAMRNISGNNSYAGAISMFGSTRFVSDSGTLTLSGNIASSSGTSRSVVVSGTGDILMSGILGTTVTLVNKDNLNGSGTGTLTLSGNNTYAGATNISAGTVKLGAAGNGTNSPLGTTAAGTTVSGTGTLDLNGFTLSTAEGLTLSGTGISNSGALANSSATATSYSGLAKLGADASIVSTGDISLTHVGTITGSGFGLTLDGAAVGSSIASIIGTGAGTLTKVGSGTWTLSGANTYTGGTTLNQGTLTVGTGGTLGASTGALAVNNSNSTAAGTDAVVNLATAVDTTVGSLSSTIATPTSGTNTATINNGGSTRNFTVNQTTNGSYGGVIAGSGAFTLGSLSTANLTLTGANTYSGGTTLSGGTLVLSNNNAAGTAGIAVSGGSTILDISSGITIANDITVANTSASVTHTIAASGAYNVGTSGALKSSFTGGTPDTTATILAGTSTAGSTLTMTFSGTSGASNDSIRQSDVFSVSGSGTDLYVLQLTAAGISGDAILGYNTGSIWDLAVNGNTGNNASVAQQNYAGSFIAFQTDFGSTLADYVGAYGIDTGTNSLWAVVNYGGSFSAVPEPTAALGGLLLGAGLLRRRRN